MDQKILDRLAHMDRKLDQITMVLYRLEKEAKVTTHTLDDLTANVAAEKTLVGSLITLTGNLKSELDKITAGALTPAQQSQVDALFASVDDNKAQITTAITANTPAAGTA